MGLHGKKLQNATNYVFTHSTTLEQGRRSSKKIKFLFFEFDPLYLDDFHILINHFSFFQVSFLHKDIVLSKSTKWGFECCRPKIKLNLLDNTFDPESP